MRARNIKPGFFKNEELATKDPLARILFEGLWCMADREGRLEDRPARIKAEVLPYDECDIEPLLSSLASGGDLRSIQGLMRHKSITSTMIYAKVSPEHLKQVSDKLNFGPMPVGKKEEAC
jgi:hypothetical protein